MKNGEAVYRLKMLLNVAEENVKLKEELNTLYESELGQLHIECRQLKMLVNDLSEEINRLKKTMASEGQKEEVWRSIAFKFANVIMEKIK